jgi:hypothetical protein
MKQAGQQFTSSKIACGAHQHDYLWKLRTDTGRYFRHH